MSVANGTMFYGQGENIDMSPDDLQRQNTRHLLPRFFIETRGREDGSFHDVELVEILIPGDNKNGPIHKIDDRIKKKFGPQYAAWKNGQDQAANGTPLELLVGTGQLLYELKAKNIFTVEAVAELSDQIVEGLGLGGKELREKARKLLGKQKRASEIAEQVRKDNEIADLKSQLVEQSRKLDTLLTTMQAGQTSPVPQQEPVPHGAQLAEGDKPIFRNRRTRRE